jgi:hypothetical protein
MEELDKDGPIYSAFIASKDYSSESRGCIEHTVAQLLSVGTTTERPGMLLGTIQGGKTRTFLAIIALAFDNGFDLAVVFTKGTKALAQQTYERLRREFSELVDADQIRVFDVMHLPVDLTAYELDQKLIVICKKEDDNIRRLETGLFSTYPTLGTKRVLIVDDEADLASVGFTRTRDEGIKMNRIASQIESFRARLSTPGFLQVTATPYSLYLQPENPQRADGAHVFKPIRPAFTELVPIHDKYVGSGYYFQESLDPDSVAFYLHEEVEPRELSVLRRSDARSFRLSEALTSPAVRSIRHAIVCFIAGACIRRLQDRRSGGKAKKYSFIVHTERGKEAHAWQQEVVQQILARLNTSVKDNPGLLSGLVRVAYDDLSRSITILGTELPPFGEVLDEVCGCIPMLRISKVNSENEVQQLLDDSGQLQLRTPLNVFIGGQILDRGLTIANLIGFFYGRSPATFQQDTVLQHSRMYGVRPMEDLAVTRFYTTPTIYTVMKRIHEFDSALREAFEGGGQEAGVAFIRKDPTNRIIPCSPNKILLSSTTTLRPGRRLLPVGFQTRAPRYIEKAVADIDSVLRDYETAEGKPFFLPVEVAKGIIDLISRTLDFEESGYTWDDKAFKACLEYLSALPAAGENQGKVWCLAKRGRTITRTREGGRYQNSPDTKQEHEVVRATHPTAPLLMLFREEGSREDGWRDHPFWWPVLVAPETTETVVFASELVDEQ